MSSRCRTARASMAVVILLLTVLAAACSKKQQAKPVQDVDSAKPMNTTDEATAVFDAAEKEIGDMLLSSGGGLEQPGDPAPSPPAQPSDGMHSQGGPARLAEDRCSRACRALASMQRAADRICELAGEDDTRCKSVRARVASAREIVRSACPDCDS